MATAAYRSAPPAAAATDPRASLDWLLNPGAPLSEIDTAAAEAAIGMGGMIGSPFAANNMLRLRDSERINRLQIGQNLLQPYLQRDFAAGQQNQQIAAQAASDALKESGAMARLNVTQQGELQQALIRGDQQAADRLLAEAGLDRRQASTIAANLQTTTMNNQNELLRGLLPYALGGKGGGGGDGGRASGMREGIGGTYFMGASDSSGFGVGPNYNASRETSWRSNPMNPDVSGRGGGGGGGQLGGRLGTTLGPVLDRILKGYGLS